MKLSHLILIILLSAATAFAVGRYVTPKSEQAAAHKETAFERVTRTGTLRCGYVVMPPQLGRDPNNGAFYGIAYDIMTEAAKRLGLNVEWTEEVNFITMAEGFKTGRYDSFCFTAYRWIPSARAMDFTKPLFYMTTNAYVRADDHRFDGDLNTINTPSVKVAMVDGEATVAIRAEEFPNSGVFTMPQNTDMGILLESINAHKADVALLNPLQVMPYLLSHPGKIRRIEGHKPIRAWSLGFGFGKGEYDLVAMFNLVIDEMHTDGTIDKVLDKYEAVPNSFVRIKSPTTSVKD
ncbi:MAG: substrate-binding periplasmic protein [Bdellovibrionales bacterium]